MVMGQDGKKLSKRHGATSIDEFRRQGYIPEALLNYVALLGASYEEGKDIYTLDELAARFSLDKLNKAPAIFDYKKLEWYNGQYIRMKSDEELAELCLPYAVDAGLFGKVEDTPSQGKEPSSEQRETFIAAMPLIKERLVFLNEVAEKLRYLFAEPTIPAAEEFIPKKADLTEAIRLLQIDQGLLKEMEFSSGGNNAVDIYMNAAAHSSDEEMMMEAKTKEWAEKKSVKLGDMMMPLRVAITGARISPPLFRSLLILGKAKSLARVEKALAVLTAR
jgi:glutamyl-tRNA synthetase